MNEKSHHVNEESTLDCIDGRESVPKHHALVRILFRHHDPLEIPIESWVELGLKVGQLVSSQMVDVLKRTALETQAYEQALKHVSWRARTESQVRQELTQKGFSSDIANRIVERLKARNYVNDELYASEFIRQNAHHRSRRDMEWRLAQRGVRNADAFAHFEGEPARNAELKAARALAMKSWKRHRAEEPMLRRQKILLYLRRKGFPMGVSGTVVQELERDEKEDLDGVELP